MDAETLMTTPLEPLKFIVNGLIPQGLHVLAGSPKIGKSWLSLWLCLQVAKGKKVWEFETLLSEVLYLCLEDSFAQIQSRLFEITDEAPPTLHFAIMSETIGSGLEMQIENFIKEYPNTGLIVIDALQKVRKTVSANVNLYAADYDDTNSLKQVADKHCLAIVLVHHLRKTTDSDPHNKISGTSGIAGGADSNFVLQKDKRTENTAKLVCTGRDIEGRELFLEFNKECFIESGVNCLPYTSYLEMMTTKEKFKKTGDVCFYHLVQSFLEGEKITPWQANEVARELAEKLFPNYECVVATHNDTDNLHSHIIVNSVRFKDGKKLHLPPTSIQEMRQVNDQICKVHGLSVLEPYDGRKKKRRLTPGEYRDAERGESWKFTLIKAIEETLLYSADKESFIQNMEYEGYSVHWDHHKHILFTTSEGKSCRDLSLHDDTYLKENLEKLFAYPDF